MGMVPEMVPEPTGGRCHLGDSWAEGPGGPKDPFEAVPTQIFLKVEAVVKKVPGDMKLVRSSCPTPPRLTLQMQITFKLLYL